MAMHNHEAALPNVQRGIKALANIPTKNKKSVGDESGRDTITDRHEHKVGPRQRLRRSHDHEDNAHT